MRAFIAAEALRFPGLEDLMADVNKISSAKPVKTDRLHLTFLFLGDMDSENLDRITLALRQTTLKKFSLNVRGIGCFPMARRARVLFLKVLNNQEIQENYGLIRKALDPVEEDHENFVPHLTISRFRSPVDLTGLIEKYSRLVSDQEADKMGLFSSKLTPDGPIYRAIAEFQLK